MKLSINVLLACANFARGEWVRELGPAAPAVRALCDVSLCCEQIKAPPAVARQEGLWLGLLGFADLVPELPPLGAGQHDRGVGGVLGVADRDLRPEVEGYLHTVVAGS